MFTINFQELTLPSGQKWNIASFLIDFTGADFNKAKEQARLKSQFTMPASQAGEFRSDNLKYQRQLMGVLAEMGVQSYLTTIIEQNNIQKTWKIVRYDDVRTNGFKSPANEYDIRIRKSDESSFLSVECRSSILHDRSLITGLVTCNIIGPYASVAKSGEGYNDFYFLPLFEFLDYNTTKYSALNFESSLTNGRIKMHLVGGCLKDALQKKGGLKSLGQGSTLYQVIQILNATDAIDFIQVLTNVLK